MHLNAPFTNEGEERGLHGWAAQEKGPNEGDEQEDEEGEALHLVSVSKVHKVC
jgi:hypothetical protein